MNAWKARQRREVFRGWEDVALTRGKFFLLQAAINMPYKIKESLNDFIFPFWVDINLNLSRTDVPLIKVDLSIRL